MAAAYITEVRRAWPRGPLHLGGFSMGGLIAYEMAQELARAGEEVASLVIVDSDPGQLDAGAVALDEQALLAGFLADLEGLSGLHGAAPEAAGAPPEGVLALLRWAAERHLGGAAALGDARRLFDAFAANLRAMARYHPEPYPGALLLIQATHEEGALARAEAFARLARGGASIHRVDADHHGLLRSPHVDDVAKRIRRRLDGEPT